MKLLYCFFLIMAPAIGFAQEKGILFEHSLSWTAVQAKAKAEHKYIFMDCFTTWCGPCKYMSANIFPMENVGDFFNKHFISVKVQLDTTKADNEAVKSWYQSGHDLANNYMVRAYPTYLFFNEDGEAVHRTVGSSDDSTFLAKAADALDPEKQYYSLLKKYNAGQKDTAFLHKMATISLNAYYMVNAKKIADEYLATQTNLYTKSNLEFIENFTQSSKDKGFMMMLQEPEKVDAVLGKGVAGSIVTRIITQEEIFNKLHAADKADPDWKKIEANIDAKYPKHDKTIIANGKIFWYQSKGDWMKYKGSVQAYLRQMGPAVNGNELNQFGWTIFQNCKDKACLEAALEWSKQSFAKDKQPGFLDTYANLLYKLGKKDQALEWEAKAMAMAEGNDKKGYQDVIDKMNKGEKTWED